MRIQLLGPLRVWIDGREIDLGPPGRRAVLGMLVLSAGAQVPAADLAGALWDGDPPPTAKNVLQTHVKHLRRLLEPDRPPRRPSAILPHVNSGYALRLDAGQTDLGDFRRLVGSADDPERAADSGQVAALLGEALRLWHGRPLADIPSLAGHPRTVALVAERNAALTRYCAAAIEAGVVEEALPTLSEGAAVQPLDEHLQACLIRAHRAAGRRATAFQIFRDIRTRLDEELGVLPGHELTAAYAELLRDEEPTPVVRQVPAQLPAAPTGFTGRTADLSLVDDLVAGGSAVTVICGTAGVGKTAMALHWAHGARERFPDGQLYANLHGHAVDPPARATMVLARFLAALGTPAEQIPAEPESAAAMFRTLLAGRRVLVVLDNAANADQVRPLLPGTDTCQVVVTSRDRLVGLVVTNGAQQVALDVLSAAEAMTLLERVLGRHRVHAEWQVAAEFVELCARLPLALRIAAAKLVDHPRCSIADHVAELRAADPLTALDVPGDDHAAVRTAFRLSYTVLPAEAQRVFRYLSLAQGADISIEAVAALTGTPVPEVRPWLDRLARAHLLAQCGPDRYSFHDLLRHYAVEQNHLQDTESDRWHAVQRWHDWYLCSVDAVARVLYPHMLRLPVPQSASQSPPFRLGAEKAVRWLDAERANLVATIGHAAEHGPRSTAYLLADQLRGSFWVSQHNAEWAAVGTAALNAADGNPKAAAAARLSLADLHFRQGRYRHAVRHYTHALVLARRAGWVEGHAAVMGNLGGVYWQYGLLSRAAGHFERGLRLSRATGQVAGEAVAFGNLGVVHWEWGRIEQAAEYYEQALDLYRRLGSRYGEAINLGNLGQVRHAQARTVEATKLFHEALATHRELGGRHGESEVHNRLAGVLRDAGRYQEAREHAQFALEAAEEIADPRAQAEALTTLGDVLRQLGNHDDAVELFRRALRLVRATGDRYPEVETLLSLAVATQNTGMAREALTVARQRRYRALAGKARAVIADIHEATGGGSR